MRVAFQLGDFVEDTVGHQLLSAVKEHGFAAHAAYGTYLWDDGQQQEVHVRHIDGRKFLSEAQREELGYRQHGLTRFERTVKSREAADAAAS